MEASLGAVPPAVGVRGVELQDTAEGLVAVRVLLLLELRPAEPPERRGLCGAPVPVAGLEGFAALLQAGDEERVPNGLRDLPIVHRGRIPGDGDGVLRRSLLWGLLPDGEVAELRGSLCPHGGVASDVLVDDAERPTEGCLGRSMMGAGLLCLLLISLHGDVLREADLSEEVMRARVGGGPLRRLLPSLARVLELLGVPERLREGGEGV